MKQLLLRVDDQLHAELTAQAATLGRSVNALANEVLNAAMNGQSAPRRERLNQRLAVLGVADLQWGDVAPTAYSREDAIAETKGIGPVVDDQIDIERATR